MTNHIRVITAIVFSQLVVLYFGFRMDVSLTGLLTTVAVASLVEIIYHVKLVRKIGANISFETFWKNCDQLFRKMLCCWLFYFVTCLFLKVGISWPSFFGKLPLLSW